MPLREFADEGGTVWLAWSTLPRSGANVRPQYADGWLSFQIDGGDVRFRLSPVPPAWDAASEDELRAYLRRAVPLERAESPSGTAEVLAKQREEQVAEIVERDRAERNRREPGASPMDGGALERIKKILRGIHVGRANER